MENSNSRYCPVSAKDELHTVYHVITRRKEAGLVGSRVSWDFLEQVSWVPRAEMMLVTWMMPHGSWKGGPCALAGESLDPASASHWLCNSGQFLHNWASKPSPVNLGANWSILFLSLYLSAYLLTSTEIYLLGNRHRYIFSTSIMCKLNSCYLHLPIVIISRFLFIHMHDVVTDHLPLSVDIGLPGYRPFSDSLVYRQSGQSKDRQTAMCTHPLGQGHSRSLSTAY